MWVRILSAVVGLGILAAALLLGSPYISLALAACMVIAQTEMVGALKKKHALLVAWPGYAYAALCFFVYHFGGMAATMLLFAAAVIACLIVFIFDEKVDAAACNASIQALAYPALPFSFLIMISDLPQWRTSLTAMVFTLFYGMICDISAYFGGRLFGRHKLLPRISPKKTIEGAVSGLIGSVLMGFLIWYAGEISVLMALPLWVCLAAGVLLGVSSQVGDLAASAIKRSVGVKDYGRIMPGHGGILDRFDSWMINGVLVSLLVLLAWGGFR